MSDGNPYSKVPKEELRRLLGFQDTEFRDHEVLEGVFLQLESRSFHLLYHANEILDVLIAYCDVVASEGSQDLDSPLIASVKDIHQKILTLQKRVNEMGRALHDLSFLDKIPDPGLQSVVLEVLRHEQLDLDIIRQFLEKLESSNPLDRYKAARQICFHISRISDLRGFGKEHIVYPGTIIIPSTPLITYAGYSSEEINDSKPLSEQSPSRELQLVLPPQSLRVMREVPFTERLGKMLHISSPQEFRYPEYLPPPRSGCVYSPFAVEAVYSMPDPYGNRIEERNSLLQYQEAISRGLISGAVVQISGVVDRDFLRWISGTAAGDFGPIPDVEIVYVIQLPSGGTFHFPLKLPRLLHTSIRYPTVPLYTESAKDTNVIQAIRSFLTQREKTHFQELLGGSESLRAQKPASIQEYEDYEDAFQESIYNILENSFASILKEQEVAIHDEVVRTRGTPEQLDPVIRQLVMDTGRGRRIFEEVSPEKWEEAITAIIGRVVDIRNKEYASVDPDRAARFRDLRTLLGYDPELPPEGFPLPLHYIITDTLLPYFSKKGKEEVHFSSSYENPHERFEDAAGLLQFLANTHLDRLKHEISVYDPFLPEKKRLQTEHGATDRKAEKKYRETKIETVKRAAAYIINLTKEIQLLDRKSHRTFEEENRRKQIHVVLDRYGTRRDAISHFETQCKAYNTQKDQVLKRIRRGDFTDGIAAEVYRIAQSHGEVSPDAISSIFEQQATRYLDSIYGKLENLYRECIQSESEWNSFATRVVKDAVTNQISFMYVILEDGTLLCNIAKGTQNIVSVNHSELAGGRNVYAGGEIVVERVGTGSWRVREVNNGSGHYRPDGKSLYYVCEVLRGIGFDITNARLVDSILRIDVETGVRLHPAQISPFVEPEVL